MKELRLVLIITLLLVFPNVVISNNGSAETSKWTPNAYHEAPGEVELGESQDISVTVDAYNITSVYLNWWDVEGREFQRSMEREPQDNLTWTYTIPPQEKEGKILYNFTVRKELERWHHPEDGERFEMDVKEEERDWTDYRYYVMVGAVLLLALILFEMIRRRIPTGYKKDYRQPVETDEDRWRRL